MAPQDNAAEIERLLARVAELEADKGALVYQLDATIANLARNEARVAELDAAITEFGRVCSMAGGPSLAMQRHDPTWEAWKKLCDVVGGTL